MLKYIQLDLLKESIEGVGIDLGVNVNDVEYRNYLINKPIIFNDYNLTTNIEFDNPDNTSITPVNLNYVDYNNIDKYIDYNSNDPFRNLPNPPQNSKILTYWKRGDVKAKIKLGLTFSDYIKAQKLPIGQNLKRLRFSGNSGNGYKGKGNGLNNPINLSYGNIAKMYNSISSKKMSDGQNNAVFSNIVDGLAASMHFIIKEYHGKNLCQLNNKHQGYVNLDSVPPPKGIGDPFGMASLRLQWVTHQCRKTGIGPFDQLDLKDKDTLFELTNSMSRIENGMTFERGLLEQAYNKIHLT